MRHFLRTSLPSDVPFWEVALEGILPYFVLCMTEEKSSERNIGEERSVEVVVKSMAGLM